MKELTSNRTMTCTKCGKMMREYDVGRDYVFPLMLCEDPKCFYHSEENCCLSFPDDMEDKEVRNIDIQSQGKITGTAYMIRNGNNVSIRKKQ